MMIRWCHDGDDGDDDYYCDDYDDGDGYGGGSTESCHEIAVAMAICQENIEHG
jgi:hypothetical protein